MKAGWESRNLGGVCELIARGVAPKYVEDSGMLVLNQKCIRDHRVNADLGRRHDESQRAVRADRIVKLGDVLVNSTGTGTLGRVAQVRAEPMESMTVDTHVTIVRPLAEKFHMDFFGYMMIQIEDELAASGEGASGQTELARSTLADKFEVSYPKSIEEQRRIVAVLDKAFADIATATVNAQKNLSNARALFESYVQSTFSKRSSGWTTYRFDQICENLDGRRRPVTKNIRTAGEIPYYGASGQVDSVADFLFDEDLLLVSEDGANLLMRTYPIAFSISGKSWVNNHAHVLRFSSRITQSIVEYYLNSISLEPFVSGMAQPKLNQKSLNSIPIPLPPEDQRIGMVEVLDYLSNKTASLAKTYELELSELRELKQSFLQKAFAGELN